MLLINHNIVNCLRGMTKPKRPKPTSPKLRFWSLLAWVGYNKHCPSTCESNLMCIPLTKGGHVT